MLKQIPGASDLDRATYRAMNWLREYIDTAIAAGGGGGGVTAHSLLTGLTVGDDHPQYLNNTRGDARYLQKANNLSDVAVVATARANLGLGGAATLNVGTVAGTVAAGDDSRITGAAQKASNLSDLASAATARTNLGLVIGTDVVAFSHVGSGGTAHAAVTTTVNGFMSAADKTKLDGVAAGATANATDASLRDRSTHTGTQASSTVTAAATARILGRITAGAGAVEELTGTQATTLLDVFTGALKGLVPSGGTASTFLRGDGSWQAIAGGGDMLRANNLSDVLSVATARTNLGLSSLATLVPPGTTTTYLRGDGTFQTLPLADVVANASTAAQTGFAADTYVTGSNVTIGGRVKAGTVIKWRLHMTKTAAGVATPTFVIRMGTAGTVADAAAVSFLTGAQTAAVDRGTLDIECTIRSVSATGTVYGDFVFSRQNTTNVGFWNVAFQVQTNGGVSGSINTAAAGLIVGLSMNFGASAAVTVERCSVQAYNLT